MGFKNNGYLTMWGEPQSKYPDLTSMKGVSSYKKQDGSYEQDFGAFVSFRKDAAAKAMSLKEKDRIKLGECMVTSTYKKDTKQTFTNFNVYDFEVVSKADGSSVTDTAEATATAAPAKNKAGIDIEIDEGDMPF